MPEQFIGPRGYELLTQPHPEVVERFRHLDNEAIVSLIVGGLIECEGDLNKYASTIQMALTNFEAARRMGQRSADEPKVGGVKLPDKQIEALGLDPGTVLVWPEDTITIKQAEYISALCNLIIYTDEEIELTEGHLASFKDILCGLLFQVATSFELTVRDPDRLIEYFGENTSR